jgi:NADH-quinone oxidoreductase E subunit
MPFELSQEIQKRINEEIIPRYPRKKSAILPILWEIQEEHGYISREGMLYTAEILEMPPAHVFGVLTFYTMFEQEPIGKFHLQVCRTATCEIMGCKEISQKIKDKIGIESGQTSEDQIFTFTEVECLASCELAPMMQVNKDNYGPLTPEIVDVMLDELKEHGEAKSTQRCL